MNVLTLLVEFQRQGAAIGAPSVGQPLTATGSALRRCAGTFSPSTDTVQSGRSPSVT